MYAQAAALPVAGIFDLPLTFSLAGRVLALPGLRRWMPTVSQLVTDGTRPIAAADNNSVFLQPQEVDLFDIREWIATHTARDCSMLGRFGFRRRIDGASEAVADTQFKGLRYTFSKPETAMYFAMRFSDHPTMI